MSLTGECRCCRKPIDRRYLACWPHWRMLPKPLKDAIFATVNTDKRAYVKNVEQADAIWQAAGIWKPGVPMSTRADKGMEALRAAANLDPA